jgi:hypothetical protein
MDLEKLAAVGKDIGLSGKALQDFISEQQQLARDQRQQERDLVVQKKELTECELRVEKMRQERLQDGSEKEIVEMQYNTEKIKQENIEQGSNDDTHSKHHARSPILLSFQEGKDDMDAFLQRFERYAVAQGWRKETEWAVNLGALLSGKGLHEYSSMNAHDANDYDKLKEAVLRAYQMTEDGFRQKLRSAKPTTGETGTRFGTRLANYLCSGLSYLKLISHLKPYVIFCCVSNF